MQDQEDSFIRVLVGDSTHIYTQLLADAVTRDPQLKVVAAASRATQLLEHARHHQVDIAVISSSMDENPVRGIEVLREMRALRPSLKGIILLESSKKDVILQVFRAGARGVFSRHESLEILCKCVRRVHEGQIWASAEQMSYAVEALASTPNVRAVDANGLQLLSKREVQVVQCLAEGLTNRGIGERLGLSQHTIKNYLFRVFDKLGVSSRIELLSLTLTQPNQATTGGEPIHGPYDFSSVANCQVAAEKGILSAQVSLANIYEQGLGGVPRNLVRAYMWYLVSEKRSLETVAEISAAKRNLAENMTTDELLEAQRSAIGRLKKNTQSVAEERNRESLPTEVAASSR